MKDVFFTVDNKIPSISKKELEEKLNENNIYEYHIDFILRPINLFTNKDLKDSNEFKVLEDCILEIHYTFINGILGNSVKKPSIFNIH